MTETPKPHRDPIVPAYGNFAHHKLCRCECEQPRQGEAYGLKLKHNGVRDDEIRMKEVFAIPSSHQAEHSFQK